MIPNEVGGVFFKCCEQFKDLTKNPEEFLQQNSNTSEDFINISKSLHNYVIQSNTLTALKSKSLPQLLINGFDDEQILQQLEIQNISAFNHLDSLSEFDAETLSFNVKENLNGSTESNTDVQEISDADEEGAMDASESDDGDENTAFDGDSEDDMEPNDVNLESKASKIRKGKVKDINESDLEDPVESKNGQTKSKGKRYKHKSKVDDQFFKLSKLEQFLYVEDLKEEKARDGELEEDDEDIDFFEDITSDYLDESDEEEDGADKKSARDLMYEDFFDEPNSADEENAVDSDEMSDLEEETLDNKNYSNEEESENDDEFQEKMNEVSSKKTPFELQQENINKTISEYEESLLKPKPWQLTGEVDVNKRPIDGLLDLTTDFQMNAKPVIIQDKEFCEKIENLIKMTKKNKAYSDGVRKQKPDKEVITHKKEIVLDQNKSKKGLAQEYEEMYCKKQSKQEKEEENPKHNEIKRLMDSLFPELYALFSHIPKPAIPEIKIVSNLPAITVEDVAPIGYSDVTLLAPEEVKKRTGIIKGKTERTETDRKRERRKKKLHQKMKQKEKENSSEKPLSRKAQKQEKLEILKKLKQHRNTKIANMNVEKIKSSKDFFERLQDTVTSNVSKKEMKLKKKI
ncbi:u3 small nucleolar ribonucleoprotein protein MPP10 [Nephila pilipes]|uniref:U3 small nucleolar ribonucleoprotein protein MPP10 n=1 Tax=Nephila pilipes TaxID=299642 RepID=A0A8X6UK83_NEPPI|nr:u3 small nucleolar ribonucleoprotein protein MPP10 [Nephila pilipes]